MHKRSILLFSCFAILTALVTAISLNGCKQRPSSTQLPDSLAEGRRLAEHYCQSCHRFPEPSLIDKKSWISGVLPAMAEQLHIQNYMGEYFADQTSALSTYEWQKIVSYYKASAPDSLIIPKPSKAPVNDWAVFEMKKPLQYNHDAPAMTTMLEINPFDHQLYSADAANNFYKWDGSTIEPKLLKQFSSPVTGIEFLNGEKPVVTCIGQMAPINVSKGKVMELGLGKNAINDSVLVADSLPRPVQTVAADFNKDGLTDYVTCGFGHDFGGLYLLMQQTGHKFKKSVIRGIPGGTQLITGDFNNDGWADVMCLFAQADEGVWLFTNDQKGGFITRNILHFPPIYGSSSFQLIDFNHDGKLDVLYTCGDNSDYSKVLKPYHGVYVFINQGNWRFRQGWFYHIDGCSKAIATDFDGDGDLDIATIAFFSDFKYHPEEGFLYFEQTKQLQFTTHAIPVSKYGRWITMTAGDVNHDGAPDIVLGNFTIGERGLLNQKGFTPQWDMYVPIIILQNNTTKAKK